MTALIRLLRSSLWPLVCAALLARVIGAVPASAAATEAPYRWRNVAVEGGGFVSGLLFHPAKRDLLYSRTDVGGAYRWDSGRHRWMALNDALGHDDSELLGVISFAVDARDPQRVYLACGSYLHPGAKPAALLSSTDQGATWSRVSLPFQLGGNADGRGTGERLQVDPHDGTVLFLGTNRDGLWRSGDRGLTWTRVAGFPTAGLTFVLFDAGRGTDGRPTPVLYAGAANIQNPAVYRSSDAGATWAPLPDQPSGLLVQHAVFDSGGTLYLAFANNLGPNDTTDGAVWKFTPAGDRWSNITPIPPNAARRDAFSYAGLAVDAQHPGTLMVATLDRWTHGDEIFRSTDGGTNWKPVLATSTWDHSSAPYTAPLKPHWIGAVALDPFNADQAFFVTGYGVWGTDRATAVDRGGSTPWVFADQGLEETVAADLISPPAGAPLLSALFDIGGFRHDDLDASPAAGALQPARGSGTSIAFAAAEPAKMVRTHYGPSRGALSLDGGLTWKDFPTAPPSAGANGPGKICLGADGRRLVWLPKGSGPYYSADDGATWTRGRADFISPNDYRAVGPVADGVNPEKFYIYDVTSGRVHVSADGGVNFIPAAVLPPGGGLMRTEPGVEGCVWVPTPLGLFSSIDSGRTFRQIEPVTKAYQLGFGCAAPRGKTPTLFVAGQVHGVGGLFRSDDGGSSWQRINEPALQFGWINALAGDSRVFGRVYVGTGGRGIFVGEPARP